MYKSSQSILSIRHVNKYCHSLLMSPFIFTTYNLLSDVFNIDESNDSYELNYL